MKTLRITFICFTMMAVSANSQGWFDAFNQGAYTRIGTIDGPLAERGIWAQFLAGLTADSLSPVGTPVEHYVRGLVGGKFVQVPGIPEYSYAMVQMVAWDGRLWGPTLAGVPVDQLGWTDIVPVKLWPLNPGALDWPHFTQPAIVPVPEPSVWALGALGVGFVLGLRSRRRWRAAGRSKLTDGSEPAHTTTAAGSSGSSCGSILRPQPWTTMSMAGFLTGQPRIPTVAGAVNKRTGSAR